MSDIDKKLDEITKDFIKHSLELSEDVYQEVKITLLCRGSESQNIRNYLEAVFNYIDNRRPKLIGTALTLITPSSEV